MPMPEDSGDATRFVVMISTKSDDTIERESFVFEGQNTITEIFKEIFHEGRLGFSHTHRPYCIEIIPDLNTLPRPKTVRELMEERIKERAVPS